MKVIFSCGGTGGHIYPAIAIADKVKEHNPDAQILFIGTRKGMENRLVPAAGYEIKGIDASGFNRRNLLANFKTAKNLITGGKEAAKIIKDFGPDFVVGTGGYVTGTVLSQANKQGIPCYIHEQNAFPGMANRLLEAKTNKVFISFEESAKLFKNQDKLVLTGNPVRGEFAQLSKDSCREQLGMKKDSFVVLIFGGSLGAEVINSAALRFIDGIAGKDIELYFVTGRRYFEAIKADAGELPSNVKLIDYADNMPVLMTASDLVVSRAGAIAVSEIMACGKPSILIPSPNVTNNHQYHNAKAVADADAAVLLEESVLTSDYGKLGEEIERLSKDKALMQTMSEKALERSSINAAELIYSSIVNV